MLPLDVVLGGGKYNRECLFIMGNSLDCGVHYVGSQPIADVLEVITEGWMLLAAVLEVII